MKHDNNRKRELILNDKKSNRLYILAAVSLIILLSASGYYFFSRNSGADETVQTKSAAEPVNIIPAVKSAEVRFSLPEFNDGRARFYSYDHNGTIIKYFILKSSDGKIRAAFDACDVCWRAGRGYSQDGDYMVCNNCGRSFITTMINVVSGGCNPSPLAVNIAGNEAVIKLRDIVKGEGYFAGVQK